MVKGFFAFILYFIATHAEAQLGATKMAGISAINYSWKKITLFGPQTSYGIRRRGLYRFITYSETGDQSGEQDGRGKNQPA